MVASAARPSKQQNCLFPFSKGGFSAHDMATEQEMATAMWEEEEKRTIAQLRMDQIARAKGSFSPL